MSRISLRRRIAPLLDDNPVTVQILGLCSALAVTTSVQTALTMSLALTAVLIASNTLISLIRRHLPSSIRLIIQITIIASLVIVVDQLLQAFWFEMSERLSIFVSLIVTNCLVMGRAEGFASRHPVGASAWDGLINGLGYSLILLLIGAVRELLGSGRLLGYPVLLPVDEGGYFTPLAGMLQAPSAFFVIALLIWALRSLRPAQVEPREFPLRSDDPIEVGQPR